MLKRLIVIAVLLTTACANEVDDTENLLLLPKAEGACGECLSVGAWYRFTELKLTDISGGTDGLKGALNQTWALDILKHELTILMEVVSVDASQVEFRLVNGARVGESGLCRLLETEVSMIQPFEGDELGASEPTTFYVFAGSQAHPKNCNAAYHHSIPVSQVVVTSGCSGVCDPIEEDFIVGEFNGAMSKSGFNGTCTCLELGDKLSDEACGDFSADYIDDVYDGVCDGCGPEYKALGALVGLFNMEDGKPKELNFGDCEELAGEPAVCVTATFRASRMLEAPPACE
jgi:hypothetical protein